MEPITRQEMLMDGQYVEPITRTEKILAGEDIEPVTRYEYFLKKYRGGGGGDIDVVQLSVTENGDYTAPEGKAYSPVHVAVPESVLTTKSITANGTYNASSDNADGYSSVTVDVPLPENAYLLKSYEDVPASIATFSDGSNLPVKELIVNIDPIQSGSGDPSPSNVRPISGWSAVNITDCGKNYFSAKLTDFQNGTAYGLTKYIALKLPYNTYTISTNAPTGNVWAGKETPSGTSDFTRVYDGTPKTVTTDILYIGLASADLETAYSYNTIIEVGSQPTTYAPYNGHTYTIQLGDTYYGCTLNVTTGLMVVERAIDNMANLTWSIHNNIPHRFTAGISAYMQPSGSYSVANDLICSCYKNYSQNTIFANTVGIAGQAITGGTIFVYDDNYDTPEAFKTAMANQTVCYKLATPIEVQLTPTQVNTILGQNNLYADSGDVVKLDYLAKEV